MKRYENQRAGRNYTKFATAYCAKQKPQPSMVSKTHTFKHQPFEYIYV